MGLLPQEKVATSDHPCSSMTTSTNPCFNYDVFLSFQGDDTRKTFTDHLYAALRQAGIRTFRDNDAMDRGKPLETELQKAIRESAVSIIVFSRNYASSKWCLDEVLMIIKEHERLSSKHEVVPVFYNVEPSDVRNQAGSFKEAFCGYEGMIEAETDHQKKIEWSEKVKAWRVSLRKAGSITGMVLADGYEAEFISKIVDVIKKKLKYKLLYVEDKLHDIENDVAEIESWLQDPSPDAVILCNQGMRHTGETTISKCVYNSNYNDYDDSCFLADIDQNSSQHGGLLCLLKQLFSKIIGEEVIRKLVEGIVSVTNALCNKKVLLVQDDITTRQQLTVLLGPQLFHKGSKVIITTRHKWLLNHFKVHPKVHYVGELYIDDSNKLFGLYAFDRDHLIEPYVKLLGSSFKGKTITLWEDAMCKPEADPNTEIQNISQLSYDPIEDSNDQDLCPQEACILVDEDKEFIVKLLGDCDLYPSVGIQNPTDRYLLYLDDGRVIMHPLIKQMGQEVVHKQSPKFSRRRSRL